MTEGVGRLVELGELRKPMKIREGTRKAQSSELVLNGGSVDSQGGSINTDGNAVMSEAIQEGVQQEFALKEVIPFRIV